MEEGTHPLVPSLSARIELLGEVPQVVVVVEVEQGHQILQPERRPQGSVSEAKGSSTHTHTLKDCVECLKVVC